MAEPYGQERALYIISVAAELAGVHAQTLRIYERKGLIEPQRTEGGSRRYSDRDIALLHRIQELTTEGVSLAGVRKVLDLEDRLELALERLAALEHELEALRKEHRRELVPLRPSAPGARTRRA